MIFVSCKTVEPRIEEVYHPDLPQVHELDRIDVVDGEEYGLEDYIVIEAKEFSKIVNHLKDLYSERDRRIAIIDYYKSLLDSSE